MSDIQNVIDFSIESVERCEYPIDDIRYGPHSLAIVSTIVAKAGKDEAEKFLVQFEQGECPVIHHFGPGQYIREVTLPAGSMAMGHFQKTNHMNVMLSGRATMITDDGGFVDICAPMMFVGGPGRKIGFIWSDVTWLNVYATDEQDVETLENMFIEKSEFSETAKLAYKNAIDRSGERIDYEKMLKEFGLSEEYARGQSERKDDMSKLPYGAYKIKVSDSSIEGKGLFATAFIKSGDIIAPARIDGKRTIAGRFVNHSGSPNCKYLQNNDGSLDLVAIKDIGGSFGGFDGEEITVNYRDTLSKVFPYVGKVES